MLAVRRTQRLLLVRSSSSPLLPSSSPSSPRPPPTIGAHRVVGGDPRDGGDDHEHDVDHHGAAQDRDDGDHLGRTSTATATSRTSGGTMDPVAVLLERPRRAGDPSARLQIVENPGCVRLWHGKQCRDERSIGHRLHGQPAKDGRNNIVGGGESGHDEWPPRPGGPAPARDEGRPLADEGPPDGLQAPGLAQARWRRLDGAHLLPLVRAGIVFVDGVQPEGKANRTKAKAA
jgi:hypothetical protein